MSTIITHILMDVKEKLQMAVGGYQTEVERGD